MAFDGSMTLLGTIFGTTDKADKIIAYVDEQQKEISEKTKDIADEEKPSVPLFFITGWMLYIKRREQKILAEQAKQTLTTPITVVDGEKVDWFIVLR